MTDNSDNREKATEALERAERDMRINNQADAGKANEGNPPRTTTGRVTSPKFGSATSGGGEIEPGPERD
jgi:hypothetical protein